MMEQKSRLRTKRGQLEHVVLSALVISGTMAIAIAAPNAVRLLKHVDPDWILKPDPKQRLRETASRLRKKGYVTFVEDKGRRRMLITPKGKVYLEQFTLTRVPKRPKKWDGKWRLVVFDISEKRRLMRDKVRNLVIGFGFVRLQDSIWVYPYDCEELIALLKAHLKIGTEVLYIIADAIEYDKPLRESFGLPRE